MTDFVDAVSRNAFLQHALIAGLLASPACGVVGSYVVVRRISYLAASVAHCTLGGMGIVHYLQVVHGLSWLHPLQGAVVAALAGALVMGWVSLRYQQREDTVIGAIWAVSMAIGLLFIAKTPGYSEDLMSYLFGSILLVSPGDLWTIAVLDAVVLGLGILLYHRFVAVCFDAEFARLRGLRVELHFLLLLSITALTVVVLVAVVGLILVIALLTLPAAISGRFASRLWQMMALATLICGALTTAGLFLSYGPGLPPGATTVALAGICYLIATSVTRRRQSPS